MRILGPAMRSASALGLVIGWSSILVTVYGENGENDAAVLQSFIDKVGSDTTFKQHWTGNTPWTWNGVTCNGNAVTKLNLSSGNLRGEIPDGSLSRLLSLTDLALDNNSLRGRLPSDLAKCRALRVINIAYNNFTGELPPNFTVWETLSVFDASRNSFTGTIPESLMHHRTVKTIDLSYNRLNGTLPDLNASNLTSFNVSHNNLTGAVPPGYDKFDSSSFQSNSFSVRSPASAPTPHSASPSPAPAPPPHSASPSPASAPPGSHNISGPAIATIVGSHNISGPAIAAIVLAAVIALLVPVLMFFACAFYKTRKALSADGQSTRGLLSPIRSRNSAQSVPYSARPLSATDVARPQWLTFFKQNQKFDLDVILEGSAVALREGTLGKSFKVDLHTRDSYVVKQLRTVGIGEGAFHEKMTTLGLQQHENLMPITAYFCGREEKLLITEHMENGSLLGWLQDKGKMNKPATWDTRIRIAVGAAKGIKHLHEHDLPHGRIKSSNVFLTNEGTARLSDYGLAEIVLQPKPTGYPDTQMARTGDLRFKQDIHDFGLLLSELFHIELPSSSIDTGDSEGSSPNSAQPIFQTTGERGRKVLDRLHRIVENCLKDSPKSTPTIQEVLDELRKVEIGEDGKDHCFPTF